jgi:peroxiredoxin (alkyl hydroperoxide reductase subunit C)
MSDTNSTNTTNATPSQPASLRLGDKAPDFEANSTHGPIKFSQWANGSWVILFSHPADFTPVCTTEFVGFAKHAEAFTKKGVKLIGNSIDSIYSHIAWVRDIEKNNNIKIPFPVIADLDQKVARLYGMVHEPMAVTATVRCVFVIDPNRAIRAMIYYPLTTGRSIDEIMRLIDALQVNTEKAVATPEGWMPGDDYIVPPPTTQADAEKRMADKSLKVTDWYFSKKSAK